MKWSGTKWSICATEVNYKKKLLEEETLTLDKVKTLFWTFEWSETHSKHMEPHEIDDSSTTTGPNGNDEINWVRHTKQSALNTRGLGQKHTVRESNWWARETNHMTNECKGRQLPYVIIAEKVDIMGNYVRKQKTLCVMHTGENNISLKCVNQNWKKCIFFRENSDEEKEEVFFILAVLSLRLAVLSVAQAWPGRDDMFWFYLWHLCQC